MIQNMVVNLTMNNDGSKLHLQWSSVEIENEKTYLNSI